MDGFIGANLLCFDHRNLRFSYQLEPAVAGIFFRPSPATLSRRLELFELTCSDLHRFKFSSCSPLLTRSSIHKLC